MAEKTWSIYSDLSGVAQIDQGGFYTKAEALGSLVDRLVGEKARIQEKLTRARRQLRAASVEGDE